MSARGGQQGVWDVERVKHAALCAAMASAGAEAAAVLPPAPNRGVQCEMTRSLPRTTWN